MNYFYLLLLQLENSYVVNVRVFRIQFIMCNWILVMQENMTSDSKIKVDKLVGKTNWAKWKWQMNVHFQQCDMMSIIDGSRKFLNVTNTERRRKMIRRIFWRGSAIAPGRRCWSLVRWVIRLRIWYWRTLMPKTLGRQAAALLKQGSSAIPLRVIMSCSPLTPAYQCVWKEHSATLLMTEFLKLQREP